MVSRRLESELLRYASPRGVSDGPKPRALDDGVDREFSLGDNKKFRARPIIGDTFGINFGDVA